MFLCSPVVVVELENSPNSFGGDSNISLSWIVFTVLLKQFIQVVIV